MISLPNSTYPTVLDSEEKSAMSEGDITVTLTEAQHELINDVLVNAIEAYHLVSPYDMGLHELPIDSEIVQRYSMLENMKETFYTLWSDRFKEVA